MRSPTPKPPPNAAPSPPVARAVAVLNFLAGHPEQAFTLTEIAKSLRISSATCHSLLAALTEAGYAYRTLGKTYVLGPALARAAQAALAPALVMQVVRPEMRALADAFDVVCSVYSLEGEEIIVRERAAAVSHLNWNTPYLVSHHMQAPVGGIFLAWRERELERWLAGAEPPLDEAARARLDASYRFLREHRYSFGVRKVKLADRQTARQLQNQVAATDHAMSSLAPGEAYNLAYVAAPVFAAPDEVPFGLSLAGFVEPVAGEAVAAMGEKLREACDRIGNFITGRKLG